MLVQASKYVLCFLAGALIVSVAYQHEVPYDKPYHRDVLLSQLNVCQRQTQGECALQSIYSEDQQNLVWVVDKKSEY